MDTLRQSMDVREGHEWEKFEGFDDAAAVETFLTEIPFNTSASRRHIAPVVATIGPQFVGTGATSPDVTASTNLGSWVNRRNLYAKRDMVDVLQSEAIPSAQKWRFTPQGQHLELGIAEMNLFLALGVAGLSHSLFGERLLPIGALYDPFISRGLDALNYACYQDARFLLIDTPSGVSPASEGGAHQSIASPLIGMSRDGLASFEPAFADELSVIMDWAFDYMQRSGDARPDLANWPRDVTGGSVYLRLSTRTIEQPPRRMGAPLSDDIIRGAYWLKPPSPLARPS